MSKTPEQIITETGCDNAAELLAKLKDAGFIVSGGAKAPEVTDDPVPPTPDYTLPAPIGPDAPPKPLPPDFMLPYYGSGALPLELNLNFPQPDAPKPYSATNPPPPIKEEKEP